MLSEDRAGTIRLTKIMFATDFSPVAKVAGEYAIALAQRFGATIVQAHVFEPDLFLEGPNQNSLATNDDPRRRREKGVAEFEEQLSQVGIGFCTRLSTECPVWLGILQLIAEEAPDLVIMGTQSKSTFDRLTIGSVADHVIRSAKCPVLTVGPHAKPPGRDPLTLCNILVATDFSPASLKAAQFGAWLGKGSDAHLHLLHVQANSEKVSNFNSSAEEFRSALKQTLPPEVYDRCRWEDLADNMSIAEMIEKKAANLNADLILLGTRKSSFWLTRVERGVTTSVLARAACPVLSMC